ncbi:hypothetical protein ACPOL_1050 [Acidisarcina polymorpha]|uniref:DUF1990 domain-containing protein n=1 Tax=Acidisarcina polymorpha TaxID=2211140 RepID=A0A2Z5FU86_9BACT|nr:DUF1990 domain-containing protein [Acidisarcina polymorpha]AXC10401.1 hypothetical protein ACPOL_1050 [Acidisarcina polymorpha]
MFSIRRPDQNTIQHFLDGRVNDRYSYSEVGASRSGAPAGYNVDHNRVMLGRGEGVFEQTKVAIGGWKMFQIGWVELIHPGRPVEVGMNVGILARTMGLYSLSSSRVAYLLDEQQPVRRWGFGYGTLTAHVERGEERFSVEWLADNTVWYDLFAFSQPRHPLARLGYPASRFYQQRFATDSMRVMKMALSRTNNLP